MPEQITVTTINTQMGRVVREIHGLKPLTDSDVLLMQEVQIDEDKLATRLTDETDLELALAVGELGLAIAVHPKHIITDTQIALLQERGPIGKVMLRTGEQWNTAKFRLRARGLVVAAIETQQGNELSVATAHPTVPLKFRSRASQVSSIADILSKIEEPVVLGGDMNHWPGPRKVDKRMYELAGLTPVEFASSSTFNVSRTRYAWLGKLAYLGIGLNGQLDTLLYRGEGLQPEESKLIDVPSDHFALSTKFQLR